MGHIPARVLMVFQKLSQGSETLDMSSQQLGKMFEGDSADMFGRKFPPFSLNVEGYSQHPSFLYGLDTIPIDTTDMGKLGVKYRKVFKCMMSLSDCAATPLSILPQVCQLLLAEAQRDLEILGLLGKLAVLWCLFYTTVLTHNEKDKNTQLCL